MKRFINTVLLLFFFSSLPVFKANAVMRHIRVDKVVRQRAGGSTTYASIVILNGRTVFLKSLIGLRSMRWANIEADYVVHSLCQRLEIRCPSVYPAYLETGTICDDGLDLVDVLGHEVAVMEFVDNNFTEGTVEHLRDEQKLTNEMDLQQFIRLFLIDVLIGNPDRRNENFFVVKTTCSNEIIKTRPIPIDNNAGLGTMLLFPSICSLTSFIPSYEGLGDDSLIGDVGTISLIAYRSSIYKSLLNNPENDEKILREARIAVDRLDDAWLVQMVVRIRPSRIEKLA